MLTLSITHHCFGNTQRYTTVVSCVILQQIGSSSTSELIKAMVLSNSNAIPRGHFGNVGAPSGCHNNLRSQEC